ncbi:MAG: LuxR family transcriptional regulator [Burkholderiales bacterium]|nr:LuxR family transcriptional regulator [Burkholderiales bacterium]
MNLNEFHDRLERFSAASSIEDITALLRGHARDLGFDSFVYAFRMPTHFSDAKVVMLNGYPDGWVSHYFDQALYNDDPVMAHCANHVVPVQWHDLRLRLPRAGAGERMMNEASDFGLKSGITMPIHSPHGELGVLSFAVDRPAEGAGEITRHALPVVQVLASHVHEAVRRVSRLTDGVSRPQLTPRESECLRWAADGKTSWEIGQLLSMSESTVTFHLNNAMQKLDVCNRQHAVARATLQGLIRPWPF